MGINIFKKPQNEYKANVNPVKHYVEQIAIYVSKQTGLSLNKAKEKVFKILKSKDKLKIKNPTITYWKRQENGDKIIEEDSLLNYIKETYENKEIMVPSFTVYKNHDTKLSLHAKYLDYNVKGRSVAKKSYFKYKMEGDKEKANFYNTLQKTKKIKNNSLSGAYASKSTILYNPSAHYTLTSITRTVASIGNALAESVVAGNRLYLTPETVINHMLSLLFITDRSKVLKVMSKYNLTIPTPKETLDLLLYSSRLYWKDEEKENEILEFLEKCSNVERVIIAYVNDLYHLREFNPKLIKTFLTKMSDIKDEIDTDDLLGKLKEFPEYILNLTAHTLMDDVRGLGNEYSKYPEDVLRRFVATADNSFKVLQKAEDLIKAFFVTDNIPPTLAYLPAILRRVTVLSDTDSTCATYQEWSEWYFGEMNFSRRAVGVAASVMTILTQSISHTLNLFAANMNIKPEYASLLAMKNEFYWDVMTPCNVAKHYYAGIRIQEGNVFKERELELKGVHMIASAIPKHLQEKSKQMIMSIMDKVTKKEKISITDHLMEVMDIEREIVDNIKRGNIDYLKLDKIKELEGYKSNDPGKTPYFHHLLWQEVFAPKYGLADEPTYITIKIPTTLQSKKKMNEFLDNMEDQEMANRLREIMKKYKKENIGTFRFPLVIVGERGLPEEIMPAVDVNRIVFDLVNVFYIILETIGFYRKDDMTITEMYEAGLLS